MTHSNVKLTVSAGESFSGTVAVAGDKSISHRALLFGALADGITKIYGFLASEDTRVTVGALRAMGVEITEGEVVVIKGAGMHGLKAPTESLWVGNSGTTTRLLLGILAGQPFTAYLSGDDSLNKRPMDRVAIPLRQMGANVTGAGERCTPPIIITGGNLHVIDYISPVASAQVKSAVLLAGLFASGTTSVTEPVTSRDHTERMLRGFGVDVEVNGQRVSVAGGQRLTGGVVRVPGDISSAAFFLVAAAITPGAEVEVCKVGINPTRSGILDVLQAMGAQIEYNNVRNENGEPVADITVRHSQLTGTRIDGAIIPRLIDELPILAVAAAFATGTTVIADATELRVKESDRIVTVARFLRDMGANIEEKLDGMVIHGGNQLNGAVVNSDGDHRIAMSAAVAAIAAGVTNEINGAETVQTSFPNFAELMRSLGAVIN
jgi:3-phosphoshikimate 1-carboxyvinyltransferase